MSFGTGRPWTSLHWIRFGCNAQQSLRPVTFVVRRATKEVAGVVLALDRRCFKNQTYSFKSANDEIANESISSTEAVNLPVILTCSQHVQLPSTICCLYYVRTALHRRSSLIFEAFLPTGYDTVHFFTAIIVIPFDSSRHSLRNRTIDGQQLGSVIITSLSIIQQEFKMILPEPCQAWPRPIHLGPWTETIPLSYTHTYHLQFVVGQCYRSCISGWYSHTHDVL